MEFCVKSDFFPLPKNMPLKNRNKQQGGGEEYVSILLMWCYTIAQKTQQLLFRAWHGNCQNVCYVSKYGIYFAVLSHNITSRIPLDWVDGTIKKKKHGKHPELTKTSGLCEIPGQLSGFENNTRGSIDTEERMAEIGIFDRTAPLRNSAAIYYDNNIEYVSSLSGTDRSLSGRP